MVYLSFTHQYNVAVWTAHWLDTKLFGIYIMLETTNKTQEKPLTLKLFLLSSKQEQIPLRVAIDFRSFSYLYNIKRSYCDLLVRIMHSSFRFALVKICSSCQRETLQKIINTYPDTRILL